MKAPEPKPLAVVTGASSGIGLELAQRFAEGGFDLFMVSQGKGLPDAARKVEALGAKVVESVAIDLSTYEGVEGLYARVKASGRPVDAVAINTGGVGGDFARQTDLKDELHLINLNVVSTVHLARRVVRDMLERGSGRLLFTASIPSLMSAPLQAVQVASKAFVLSFAESLHNELKSTGVTVTALSPDPTDTPLLHRATADDTQAAAEGKGESDPAHVARLGFEAMMAGKDKVIAAAFKTQVEGIMNKVLPDTARAEPHRKRAEPGSADKK